MRLDPTVTEATQNGKGERSIHGRAIEFLERRKYAEAIWLLEGAVNGDARSHGLLGTAYFLNEEYEKAAAEFHLAAADHSKEKWLRKERLARANAGAGLAATNPAPAEFERREVLEPPPIEDRDLPTPPAEGGTSLRHAIYALLGQLSGNAIDAVWKALTPLARWNHKKRPGIWTDWDEKGLYPGLFALAYMREQLENRNLKNPYPKGDLTAFQKRGLIPPAGTRHFRTPDGSWNDPSNPREGSANVRFPRNVDAEQTWPDHGARFADPNPAVISQELLSRGDAGMKEVEFLNLLAAAWVQFMVHDWVSHRTYAPNLDQTKTYDVELPDGHPGKVAHHQVRMRVGKTMPDPTQQASDGAPPTTINEVTSWWDGSQLYGSDGATTESLRSGIDGKLTLDGEFLPLLEGSVEHTGYNRNWWVGLSLLHTLFAREHNAICDELKRSHPAWDDDRLFNVARLINAAVMAKIHTVEWTPAILPNRTLKVALESNWYGLAESRIHRKNRKVLRRVKIRNGVFGGLVGNKTEKYGVPYGLSEEFVEVYRLHELLPDTIQIHHLGTHEQEEVTLPETRGNWAARLVRKHGLSDLFYSFGIQSPGQIALHNYPNALRELSVPGAAAFDVAAVDILRARERGVPRYNTFRRQLGLRPIEKFEDLTTNVEDVQTLKRIYGNVELLDMQVGTRAEEKRPNGFGFGETLFQIFILNASRRLQADRFFTEAYNAETYTQEGLDWIDRATFKSVLLRHYPELELTGLSNVTNAFEPWDTGADLDPKRHPLAIMDRPNGLHRAIEASVETLKARVQAVESTVSTLAAGAEAALTRVRAVLTSEASFSDPLPPGSFGLPLLGESLSFVGGSGPFLEERFQKHGPIFKTHVAFHPTVCLGGEKAYSFFLNEEYFSRQDGAPPNVRWLFNRKSVSFKDGPDKERVQELLLAAFDEPALGSYLPALNELFSSSVERWEKAGSFAWLPELEALSFAIIDCSFMGAAPGKDRSFWTKQFDRLTCGVVRTPFSPQLYLALAVRVLFTEYVDGVVASRRQNPGNDVVSRLLAGNGGVHLTEEELRVELVHFFLAGAPLESALAYHLLLLAQHPEVMKKARDEVESVAPHGALSLAQVRQLTYVLQTCKESRRTARLVPNTFFATVKKAFDFDGYHVPAGWKAMGLIGCTQHDASAFPSPEEYQPERFARACPMYVAHGGTDDPHRCIGERFADLVMTLLTARLLQEYTWKLVPGQDPGARAGKVAPVPAGGLQVVFHRVRTTPPQA
jgi:cytochrome P450